MQRLIAVRRQACNPIQSNHWVPCKLFTVHAMKTLVLETFRFIQVYHPQTVSANLLLTLSNFNIDCVS